MRGLIEAQLDTYEKHANGWLFWNSKTELGAHEWDALAPLDAGLFPSCWIISGLGRLART